MKRFSIFLICIFFIFSFSACKENKVAETREAVVINLPKDDSVNGYRTENPDYSDKTVVSANSVVIDNSNGKNQNNKTQNSNSNGSYCANKNSKVFHKSECGSVSSMKDENKEFFNDRNNALSNGYKPCGRCKP